MALLAEWKERVLPPPGMVYVERESIESLMPERIVVPDTFLSQKKNALARVVASGVKGMDPGLRVYLAPGVSRRIEFTDKTIWYLAYQAELMGWVEETVERAERQEGRVDKMSETRGIDQAKEGRSDEAWR